MAIIGEITQLRDDCLSSLDESHDYYEYTKSAWRFVDGSIRHGRKVSFRNLETGNTVDETNLPGMAQAYVTGYLASATFQHFVSLFERFVFDFFCAWLTDKPKSLSKKELKLETVIKAADKDEVISIVVQEKVRGITYKPVTDWFKNLEGIANLGCPNKEQIEKLAEIKASRNILVHNNGIANSKYIEDSMGHARFAEGDILELPDPYHLASWKLIKQVVTDVADAGISKHHKT